NSRMPSLKTTYEVGLDFLEFLGQRISKTDRNELRDIYNFEFKRFVTVTQSHLLSVWHICFTRFIHVRFCFILSLCSQKRQIDVSLLGESYVVEVHYKVHHHGHFPATMYFEFCPEADPPGTAKPFCIVRELEAVVQSGLAETLGPESPYNPKQNRRLRPENRILEEGVPPERLDLSIYLSIYLSICLSVCLSVYLSFGQTQAGGLRAQVLDTQLCMKNYKERFHLLLHLEEIQMEVDIKKYDLYGKTMTLDKSNKKLLILKVPGVAENRPSVLRGDKLNVCLSEDRNQPITVYEGYVHSVELERVKLGFSKTLLQKFVKNMKFNVEFSINRFPIRLQHRAVELACQHRLGDVLFPSDKGTGLTALPHLSMFNKDLENNPEQKAAVQHILSGTSKPAPYLIFGPPGTGKTVTVVEAIKQVNKSKATTHILACAPSNSACDLLCERLLGYVDAHRLYRLCAPSRDPRTVPQKLLVRHIHGVFLSYSLSTYFVLAGMLVSGGFAKGHFTHIFIDEAGQAVEPECIIGIAGLLDPVKGQLVLAGDPQQLGPILRSPLAQLHGLGQSLLERLMTQNALYQKSQDGHSGYDTRFVTKLLRNYRSHPAILKIPNELFYENELQVFANQMEREAFCCWEHLPKKGFPVVFHGVMGKDDREANSPSFFNVTEIEVIVSYLNKLMQTQGKKGLPKLSANDIGIITPYRKQVEKIRKALNTVAELNKWKDIKVGSVEEFQGQERKVIVVSTVRSSVNYVKMDQDFNIGFLSNEKRFNVAMTRAKALLAVVGNPVILSKDPTWQRFIRYCELEQGYTGFDYKDAEGEEDVVSRLASLKISSDGMQPYITLSDQKYESPLQQHVHPEWRSEQ
uniref:RNA helicase n=1 Tax=Sinocyclocheilus rhinocerous TaxID=307959 RepID=A0A673M8R7_9TELE